METSALVVTVFSSGFAVGALLVSLQRQKLIEEVRAEFEEKLAAVLSKRTTEKKDSFASLDRDDEKENSASNEQRDFYTEWRPIPRTTGVVNTHSLF